MKTSWQYLPNDVLVMSEQSVIATREPIENRLWQAPLKTSNFELNFITQLHGTQCQIWYKSVLTGPYYEW
jgi:hypothetical protein